MKALSVTMLFLTLAGVAAAQETAEQASAPDVSVVEKGWRRHVYNPALEDDPLRGSAEHMELMRAQREHQRQNNIRRELGRERLPPPTNNSSGIVFSDKIILYVYKVRLSNNGAKAIRALDWEYAFLDPETQQELGRHRYTNKVKLRPGKSVDLSAASTLPPAAIVDAKKPDKDSRARYVERVIISRVEYDDGTVWQSPVK